MNNNSIRTDSISAVLRGNLDKSQNNLSKTLQRMSSGLKILSAKDDASGAVISSKTKIELSGLNIANNNIQSGINMFNVAEGALKEAENILIKLRDLSLQAANEILGEDERKAIQMEADELVLELEKIQLGTTYNHLNLFNNQPDDKKKTTNNGENQTPGNSTENNAESALMNPQSTPSISPQSLSLGLSRSAPILAYSPDDDSGGEPFELDTGPDDTSPNDINIDKT